MSFPLTPDPTWEIRDSSKLDDFILCSRFYLYAHIFGWKMDMPAHDLHFGSCWHLAREYQLIHGYDAVDGAFLAFMSEYRKVFDQETDALYSPKTPTAVGIALLKFAEERKTDLSENKLLEIDGKPATEISGTVPVSDTRKLWYRVDSILMNNNEKVFSWDHKTTSEKYINGRQWSEQFHLSIQNGTYTHCLYCMFPIEQVLGIEFCGTGFAFLSRGSKNRSAGYHATLKRVPAFKTPQQMNVWLWNVNRILDEIDEEMDHLFHCKESDPVLTAFRMNPKSCTSYRGCPYHDFCLAWENPLRVCQDAPQGFHVEFWDPSEREASIRKDLEWKG